MISAVGNNRDCTSRDERILFRPALGREDLDTSIEAYHQEEHDRNHYVFSIDVRLLSIRETIQKHPNTRDIYELIRSYICPFYPGKTSYMGYLEIRRIFEFLRNLNMMIWSLGHKESVLELITLQLT